MEFLTWHITCYAPPPEKTPMTHPLSSPTAVPRFEPPPRDVLIGLWQANSDAMAVISSAGQITFANHAFLERFGPNAELLEEQEGYGDRPSWFPQNVSRNQRRLVRYHSNDGTIHPVWTRVVRLDATADGDAAFIFILADDFDESEGLYRNHEWFERNPSFSPLAVVEWNPEGRVVRWNASAERIFGWSAEEMIGHSFFKRIIPDIAAEQVKGVILALLRGEFANARNANVTKDGRIITCQWYNTLLRDKHGAIVGVVSQAEDVSNEEHARLELIESKALLSAIIDNLPTSVSLKDEHGRYQLVNHVFAQWNGHAQDDVHGKTDAECWPPELAALRERGAKHVFETRSRQTREERITDGFGETRDCSVVEFPIHDRHGDIRSICSVAADLTAIRRAAEERETLQQQLIESQQKALRELSTPLLPVADGVLVMPLVGHIDSGRSAMIMETLLHGIPAYGASVAILDITGVRETDYTTAEAIIAATRAGKLLGAEVLLTGMRPNVARTLVEIGANLEGIVTLATLRGGVNYALQRSRRH